MTQRYKKVLKPEILRLRRRYLIALPLALISGVALYAAVWMVFDEKDITLSASLISLAAGFLTLTANLAHRLGLIWLELYQRSLP